MVQRTCSPFVLRSEDRKKRPSSGCPVTKTQQPKNGALIGPTLSTDALLQAPTPRDGIGARSGEALSGTLTGSGWSSAGLRPVFVRLGPHHVAGEPRNNCRGQSSDPAVLLLCGQLPSAAWSSARRAASPLMGWSTRSATTSLPQSTRASV